MIQTLNFFLKEERKKEKKKKRKKKERRNHNLYILILLYHVMVYSSADVERPRDGSAAVSLKNKIIIINKCHEGVGIVE